jgi:hypothetical protein
MKLFSRAVTQAGRKNYWFKDFRYLKPKRASVTRIYDVMDLEYV